MYKYKVSGNMHLWGFINLTDVLNCRILDYSVTDNQVNYIIYISKNKWNLKDEKLKDLEVELLNKY